MLEWFTSLRTCGPNVEFCCCFLGGQWTVARVCEVRGVGWAWERWNACFEWRRVRFTAQCEGSLLFWRARAPATEMATFAFRRLLSGSSGVFSNCSGGVPSTLRPASILSTVAPSVGAWEGEIRYYNLLAGGLQGFPVWMMNRNNRTPKAANRGARPVCHHNRKKRKGRVRVKNGRIVFGKN